MKRDTPPFFTAARCASFFARKILRACIRLCNKTGAAGFGGKEKTKWGDTMGKKDVRREDVIEALKEIAFGRVNRGVELTYLSEPTAELIRKMDLSAVAEFKRNANGTVEVKFVDRVKALSALYEMLGGGDANEAAEFLEALEQAGEERDDWRP